MNAVWPLWSVALVMLLLALGGLLWPLLRESAAPTGDTTERLRALYRAQREELEHELERQALSPADRQQALDELQRRLLEDVDRPAASPAAAGIGGRWPRWLPAAALSVSMPLGAVMLYLQVGDPRAAVSQVLADPGRHGSEEVDVDAMVQRLAQRLAQQPDDLEGWVVLARSREVQEDFAASAHAYRRAATLAADQQAPAAFQARLLADLADALASSRQGALDEPVRGALDAALALDPDQPKALALAGAAAARAGDRDGARRHWQRLLARLEPDSEVALRVRSDLAALDGEAVSAAAAPAPSRGLTGTVRLASALQGQVRPGDTVFIVARAQGGGPVPVAILRLEAGRLPVPFELDDRHAMSPERRLSRFDELTLEARISRSGQADRQPGQPVSRVLPVRAGASGIELLIDATAPAAAGR